MHFKKCVRDLKEDKDVACLISSGKSFQSEGTLIAKAQLLLVFDLGSLKGTHWRISGYAWLIWEKRPFRYSGASPIRA